jgi:UPF0716 protein FxsA
VGKFAFLLLLLPFVELFLLLRLGEALGALPVLGLLLASAVLGTQLARSQGARVLRQMQAALARGETPGEGMLSAGLVVAGGVLLVVPGVVTDVLGLALLLPPTRRWVAARLRRGMEQRMRAGTLHVWGSGRVAPPTERTLEPSKPTRGEVDAEFSEDSQG